MTHFACPYLPVQVELTDEREQHIVERHPDLLPDHRYHIANTLAEPDQVRRSATLLALGRVPAGRQIRCRRGRR